MRTVLSTPRKRVFTAVMLAGLLAACTAVFAATVWSDLNPKSSGLLGCGLEPLNSPPTPLGNAYPQENTSPPTFWWDWRLEPPRADWFRFYTASRNHRKSNPNPSLCCETTGTLGIFCHVCIARVAGPSFDSAFGTSPARPRLDLQNLALLLSMGHGNSRCFPR